MELVTKKYFEGIIKGFVNPIYYNEVKNFTINDYDIYISKPNMVNEVNYNVPFGTIVSKYPITFLPSINEYSVIKSQYLDYLVTESGYYIYTITKMSINDKFIYSIDGYVYENI